MHKFLKEAITYVAIAAFALGVGWGAAQLMKHMRQEAPRVSVTDTRAHFKNLDADVVLYGTSWCPVCKKTREFLGAHHVKFVEYDLEKADARVLSLYKTVGTQTVPVIVVGNTIFRGFNEATLAVELKKKGYAL